MKDHICVGVYNREKSILCLHPCLEECDTVMAAQTKAMQYNVVHYNI